MQEVWRSVYGLPDLEASSLGRIRKGGKLISPFKTDGGYLSVKRRQAATNGNDHHSIKNFKVHRLVLMAFRGPPPPGHEGAHMDGNKSNNTIENLNWVTPKENGVHKVIHGTAARKMTKDQVWEIRDLSAKGASIADLGRIFSNICSERNVRDIVNGKIWKNV